MSVFWGYKENEPTKGISRVPRESLPLFIRATLNSLPDDKFPTTDDPDKPPKSKETPIPIVDAGSLTFSELLDKINKSEQLALEAKDRESASEWSRVKDGREPGLIFASEAVSQIRIHRVDTSCLGLNNSGSESPKRRRFGRYNFGKKPV